MGHVPRVAKGSTPIHVGDIVLLSKEYFSHVCREVIRWSPRSPPWKGWILVRTAAVRTQRNTVTRTALKSVVSSQGNLFVFSNTETPPHGQAQAANHPPPPPNKNNKIEKTIKKAATCSKQQLILGLTC